jgi:hypothetical protein
VELTNASGVNASNGKFGGYFENLGLAYPGVSEQKHVNLTTNLQQKQRWNR